ncbi:MAG: four helix bundle protein [Verrucomicrobia bacterium]|nr:four helix bundle protein [Verrucomicrobiota bacterium]
MQGLHPPTHLHQAPRARRRRGRHHRQEYLTRKFAEGTKSYAFALRIVKLYGFLCDEKKEFVLSKQIVRSGTSIGANVEEAIGGQSNKDFLSNMSVGYKEARETQYWLRLLRDSNILDANQDEAIALGVDQIRKSFGKLDQQPKILIVTGKLLTGFDAPVLYAMSLDKPMRDHTLLQAIANEARRKEQAEKTFESLTYFVYRSLLDAKIENAEAESRKIRQAFADHSNWKRSENALRELRKKVIPEIRHSQIGPARQHLSGIMLS